MSNRPPNALDEIRAPVAADMAAVNALIAERLHSNLEFIYELGQHIVASGGKRLRPLLVLLSARAHGYDGDAHTLLAAIIEFIHTATLLHDDVVDNAELRRGRRTAKAIWGNDASVLVGDFLYSRAFQMIVESGVARVTDVLADATNTIAEGEVRQLLNVRRAEVDEDDYLRVIHCKTAKLFEAAVRVGAMAAAASAEAERNAARFGLNVGLAFQLIDDVLDYEIRADTGKAPVNDLAEGKPTLPFIRALGQCSDADAQQLRDALKKGANGSLAGAVELVCASDALDYTRRRAVYYADKGHEALETLPASPYKTALERLTGFAVTRDY